MFIINNKQIFLQKNSFRPVKQKQLQPKRFGNSERFGSTRKMLERLSGENIDPTNIDPTTRRPVLTYKRYL